MAFNLQGGFGAGAGADMLQQILRQKAMEFAQAEQIRMEQERHKIDAQRAQNESDYRQSQQESLDESRKDAAHLRDQTGAAKLAGNLAIGQDLSPETSAALKAGDMGDTVKAPTLGSRNLSGTLRMLTSTPNPGRGETYLGTAPQQQDQRQDEDFDRTVAMAATPQLRGKLQLLRPLDREKRGAGLTEILREEAKPTTQPLIRVGRDGKPQNMGDIPAGAHVVNEPAPPASGGRALTPTAEANLTTKLASDWTKASSGTKEMHRQYGLMQAGLDRFKQGDKNGGSQAVLVTFQKILDPTSVVRESEYARSSAGISMLQRMQGYAEKLAQGGAGVPEAALAEMVKTANEFLEHSKHATDGQRKRIQSFADKYGIPHELVFDDDGGTPAAGTGAAAPKRIRYDMNGNQIKD